MIYLKEVEAVKHCQVDIDYYVPFSINIENEKLYGAKTCWRIGDLKKSLMEISIDEKSGMLRDITLTSVNKVYLQKEAIENADIVETGTPVFDVEGNIKNGLCDEVMDFYVYLNREYIMVNLVKEHHPYKYVALERLRLGFDLDNKLISVIVKDLTNDEFSELKAGLKL